MSEADYWQADEERIPLSRDKPAFLAATIGWEF